MSVSAFSGESRVLANGTVIPPPRTTRLLQTVVRSPNNPSPVGGYATAGAALADILYTSPSFGGEGGLSNARNGVSDVRVLAQLLDTYDRWWPRAALSTSAPSAPRRKIPVLAFAARCDADRACSHRGAGRSADCRGAGHHQGARRLTSDATSSTSR